MTDVACRLKAELLRLPADDRMELAHILWDSIDPEPADEMTEAAWIAELERRTAETGSGSANDEPCRAVIEELRRETS